MYAVNDGQMVAICFGAIVQAADDYHEWKRYESRGWRTLGRKPTARRDGTPARPMSAGEISYYTKWGEDARDWFLGKDLGGLSFPLICEAIGYDPEWLAQRVMSPDFWRALKAKAEPAGKQPPSLEQGFREAIGQKDAKAAA